MLPTVWKRKWRLILIPPGAEYYRRIVGWLESRGLRAGRDYEARMVQTGWRRSRIKLHRPMSREMAADLHDFVMTWPEAR